LFSFEAALWSNVVPTRSRERPEEKLSIYALRSNKRPAIPFEEVAPHNPVSQIETESWPGPLSAARTVAPRYRSVPPYPLI